MNNVNQAQAQAPAPTLTEFYQELQKWIEAGTPSDHAVFTPSFAMCYQACVFGGKALKDQLEAQFRAQGLNPIRPFNKSWDEFILEESQGICWHNEQRLKWVANHANTN